MFEAYAPLYCLFGWVATPTPSHGRETKVVAQNIKSKFFVDTYADLLPCTNANVSRTSNGS